LAYESFGLCCQPASYVIDQPNSAVSLYELAHIAIDCLGCKLPLN
jgi:hypothetical protein